MDVEMRSARNRSSTGSLTIAEDPLDSRGSDPVSPRKPVDEYVASATPPSARPVDPRNLKAEVAALKQRSMALLQGLAHEHWKDDANYAAAVLRLEAYDAIAKRRHCIRVAEGVFITRDGFAVKAVNARPYQVECGGTPADLANGWICAERVKKALKNKSTVLYVAESKTIQEAMQPASLQNSLAHLSGAEQIYFSPISKAQRAAEVGLLVVPGITIVVALGIACERVSEHRALRAEERRRWAALAMANMTEGVLPH